MPAWYEEAIPADATMDIDGKPTPLRELPYVKESADLPTLVKRGYEFQREIGARIPVKIDGKDDAEKATNVENWKKEHMPKLYKAGILPEPIKEARFYGITKPEKMHAGINWSEERAKKFGDLGVKHNISKEAMADFLALHQESHVQAADFFQYEYDEGILAMKKEHGDKYEERMEDAKRLTKLIITDPEELALLDRTGLGNHPKWLSMLMRLAPLARQDSSLAEDLKKSGGGATRTPEQIRAEVSDIMYNKENPKNKGYWGGDPEVAKYVDELYKSAYGGGVVQIGTALVQRGA